MVSILIPTYNYDITKLVSLLHKQATDTGIDFEIMICDDASSDQQIKLKNKKTETLPHCFYFENKSNLGRTKTRQNLATRANHNWLLFLDADVLPKNNDFISRYVKEIKKNTDVLFGGITYQENKPEKVKILRWKYGRRRENIAVSNRKRKPYQTINSGCFFIKKNIFIEINTRLLSNYYGMDILFQNCLKKRETVILHIDNPVIHLGLEDNDIFLTKSLNAVKTTITLEKNKLIKPNVSRLQKTYLQLNYLKLSGVFQFVITPFLPLIKKISCSKNPSIFLFDLYRLSYYVKLKKNA